jgi:hypothetical protein
MGRAVKMLQARRPALAVLTMLSRNEADRRTDVHFYPGGNRFSSMGLSCIYLFLHSSFLQNIVRFSERALN